jgi:hypothetical protein
MQIVRGHDPSPSARQVLRLQGSWTIVMTVEIMKTINIVLDLAIHPSGHRRQVSASCASRRVMRRDPPG